MGSTSKINIGIIGAGSFGTALASLLSKKGHDVDIWARNPVIVDSISKNGKNSLYLAQADLTAIHASTDLADVCSNKDLLIFAIPTQFIRQVIEPVKKKLSQGPILVNTAKGIETSTLKVVSEIFEDVVGSQILNRFVTLSGPTFAEELILNYPAAAVLAAQSHDAAFQCQQWMAIPSFRLYTSDDVMGVQLGGSLKNIMAIAAGILDGMGFGLNSRAALITRGLHEMTKLGIAMGAEALTFSGLSGVGDLVLSCTGDLSRNRHVGSELGRGRKIDDILKEMKNVAEGVTTVQSVIQLSQKYNVEMPNSMAVYKIIYENMSPQEALKEIQSRELKEELEGLK